MAVPISYTLLPYSVVLLRQRHLLRAFSKRRDVDRTCCWMAVMRERQKRFNKKVREMILSSLLGSLWSSWLGLSLVQGMRQQICQEGVDVGMPNQESSRSITPPINHCMVQG